MTISMVLMTPNDAFEAAEFWCVVVYQLFYVYCKGKALLFYQQFSLLLSKRGLSPESCSAI